MTKFSLYFFCSLLMFGFGKRACIGEVFAKNRAFLFFATLMQICTVTKPSDEILTHLDPWEMMPGLALQPKPYKVQFKLRNNFAWLIVNWEETEVSKTWQDDKALQFLKFKTFLSNSVSWKFIQSSNVVK